MLYIKLTSTKVPVYNFRLERSFVLTAYAISVILLQSYATAEHQQSIKINSDGSVAETSQLPECSNGARINLLSYTILNENCHSNIDCKVQLSPPQQVYIHQKCSLKEACEVMNLPTKDGRNGINSKDYILNVKYECLDHFTEFLDICDNISKPIYNTVHLLSTQSYHAKKECHCSIKDGQFSLVLNDIRLLSSEGNSCSPSELQLGFKTFNCTPLTGGYGSVFNKIFSESQMASVSLILRHTQETMGTLPQMTWLIIKPKAPLRITCESTPRHYNTTILTSIETSTMVNYMYTQSKPTEDDSSTLSVIHIVLICFGAAIVLSVAGVVGFIVRGRCTRPERFEKTPRTNSPDTPNIIGLSVTSKTDTDEESSVGYSGKHVGKDVEMKLLVKQKQNTFLPKQERRHYEPQRMSAQARYNEPITAVNDQQYAISVALQ